MLADDGSALDCAKSPHKKLKPEPASKGSDKASEALVEGEGVLDKLRFESEEFLLGFGEEICAQEPFRPLPPMLGDGQRLDLLKLFLVVRQKGGYHAVSENGLWNSVAKESGLLSSNLASPVKLVYVKYLNILERWLKRVVENEGSECGLSNSGVDFVGCLMELQAELKALLAKVPDQKMKDEEYPHLELATEEVESDGGQKSFGDEGLSGVDSVDKIYDTIKLCNENEGEMTALDGDVNGVVCDEKKACLDSSEGSNGGKLHEYDEVKSAAVELDGGKNCDDEDVVILDPADIEDRFYGKRKRESLCGMQNWVTGVAVNPCDPAVGSLPEWSKWKSYGKGEMWKQVLLAREAIFLKRQVDSSAEQWQKTQKMHPCMYDDQLGSSYNLRERLRCGKNLLDEKMMSQAGACSESSSATQGDLDKIPFAGGMKDEAINQLLGTADSSTADSVLDKYPPSRIPWGPRFEAEVPEWTGVASESDPKWLGTRVWPLENVERRSLIERDPIGKGRQDSCGCEVRGSIECARFHIAEKRLRVKLELGRAFYQWKFDKMGEEVRVSWTEEEEKKFKAILLSNPQSLQKCFWDQIFKFSPTKSSADLVSYYFNVFLLQRRGCQNRLTPNNIDSDDDESGSGLVTNGIGHEADKSPSSIFYSPKKPHTNFR
ncbi:AT-rich interactive domain-containing protein 2 isoform X2 [Corylus avellana]|nr:AT-rich interactive domain-containing protein 2 isoform X2 [Corylus avellana]XP_059457720.1 AT-rich interactive domain-containing protein 2 isoform X2 [Corylus avellana]